VAREGTAEQCAFLIGMSKRLVRIKNQQGQTPLMQAMMFQNLPVLALLREHDSET